MTPHQSPGPRPTDGLDRFCERVRATGIRRRLTDRWVAGVCAGVADAVGVDPVVVRIAWGLTLLLGGVGVAAYFLAFSLLADTAEQIPLERAVRRGDGDSVVLLVFTGLLVADLLGDLGRGVQGNTRGLGLALTWSAVAVAGVWWWLRRRRAGRGLASGSAEPSGPPGPTGTAPDVMAPAVDRAAPARGPQPSTTATTSAWARAAPARGPQPWVDLSRADAEPVGAAAPARFRRPSLGWPGALATLGLAGIGAGGVLTAQSLGRVHLEHPAQVATAAALGLCAAFLVVIGLAGRRGGLTTAVVVLLSLGLAAGAETTRSSDGWWTRVHVGSAARDTSWAPTELRGGETYQVRAGDGLLDLTHLDPELVSGRSITTDVGLGDLVVRVPQGLTVRVRGDVGLGDRRVRRADGEVTDVGNGEAVVGDGRPVLDLVAHVGLGDLTIEEVAR
ncbi:PspC domain-containing protein [Arsenicicoccus dermatophilus]|uniref:PspC domain-containing protein n=1 Tax=Arsenicicoccus dermatophilus TaxID=1076331 RepID=UPI0039172B80